MPDNERSSIDDIIELYMRDVDQTLLDENLKLTPEQRLRKLANFVRDIEEMRRALHAANRKEVAS